MYTHTHTHTRTHTLQLEVKKEEERAANALAADAARFTIGPDLISQKGSFKFHFIFSPLLYSGNSFVGSPVDSCSYGDMS